MKKKKLHFFIQAMYICSNFWFANNQLGNTSIIPRKTVSQLVLSAWIEFSHFPIWMDFAIQFLSNQFLMLSEYCSSQIQWQRNPVNRGQISWNSSKHQFRRSRNAFCFVKLYFAPQNQMNFSIWNSLNRILVRVYHSTVFVLFTINSHISVNELHSH